VDEGSRLFCPNKSCSKRVLHQLLKWQSVVDIRDLGETLITSLFKDGLLKSISDIYKLTSEQLVPYFLNEQSIEAEKKSLGAQKVYASIQNHRRMKLPVFLAGFDIEGFGETLAEKLTASGFDTLEKLLAATEDQIASVYGFAQITARTIKEGLKENEDEMRALLESGTILIEEAVGGKLAGKSFCFTGELSIKRADAEKMVKDNGGSIKSSVTKDLSYLVTNDTSSGSSKNVKAAKLGIPVIDEKEFLQLLG
jgi:DNA ligase (NAD+)